jgi:hypothetical protein
VTETTTFTIDLDGGGTADLVDTNGDRVTLRASRPFPPGAPLVGTARDGSGALRVKVRGSRRVKAADAAFLVEGRFVNLTRAQREHLARLAVGANSSAVE